MEAQIRIELQRIDHPLGPFTVTATGIIQSEPEYDHVAENAFALFEALGGARDVDKPAKEEEDHGPQNPA